jgi:hypothetical protein
MGMCRVSAVIIAAVIGGASLSACGASGSNPAAASAPAANGSATALAGSPTASFSGSSGSSSTPSASPTHRHHAAADPSVKTTASAHPKRTPHTSSPASSSSGTHSFTVPAISGQNVVTGWGSYTKIGTARVKVTMCAKQTGAAFSVGDVALAYDATGASQNLGATILTGPGNTSCVTNTFILYTAHLKVHAFIGGGNGTIVKTGPVLTLY